MSGIRADGGEACLPACSLYFAISENRVAAARLQSRRIVVVLWSATRTA
jgi:hypothetical protein